VLLRKCLGHGLSVIFQNELSKFITLFLPPCIVAADAAAAAAAAAANAAAATATTQAAE